MKLWMKWFVALSLSAIVAVMIADIFLPIDMRVAANTSLVYMAIASTVFVIGYATRSNWRNSTIGPTYLGYKTAMTVVLWQIVIAVWASPDWPGRQHARFVIYSLGVIGTVVWAATLRDVQNAAKALVAAELLAAVDDADDDQYQGGELLDLDDYRCPPGPGDGDCDGGD